MLKKIFIALLVLVLISAIYISGLILFKDYIFLTNAGFDGEPHKAKYFFLGWGGLLGIGFISCLVFLNNDKFKKPEK